MALTSCHCCGLVQKMPPLLPKHYAYCYRCHTQLSNQQKTNHWAIAWGISGLLFYVPALFLPLLKVEELGHHYENHLLGAIFTLFTDGHRLIAIVVLFFSVILPACKLMVLILLSNKSLLMRSSHKASLYKILDGIGKWGMLDVMIVAILIAYIKVGDIVSITAGIGLLAFTLMVLCNLLASLSFNSHLMWEQNE